MKLWLRVSAWVASLAIIGAAGASLAQVDCHGVDPNGSTPLSSVALPPTDACVTGLSNGFPLPDPKCTPGAFNPTVTAVVLQDPHYRTSCTRNGDTSENAKAGTYDWYGIAHPTDNRGQNQTCELDHLISLELGGADSLDNIWPQCGPGGVLLMQRFFKQKDLVKNYLAAQVKSGAMDLATVQQGIATDWTQYLAAAKASLASGTQ